MNNENLRLHSKFDEWSKLFCAGELMTCQKAALIFPSGAIPFACVGNKNDMHCVEFRERLDGCQIFMRRGESSSDKK